MSRNKLKDYIEKNRDPDEDKNGNSANDKNGKQGKSKGWLSFFSSTPKKVHVKRIVDNGQKAHAGTEDKAEAYTDIRSIKEVQEAESKAAVSLKKAEEEHKKRIALAEEKAKNIINKAQEKANAEYNGIVQKTLADLEKEHARILKEAHSKAEKVRRQRLPDTKVSIMAKRLAKEIVG